MLTRAWMESRDGGTVTAGPDVAPDVRPAQVVDLQDWRIRRLGRRRETTRALCEYVPRHRAEAELGN